MPLEIVRSETKILRNLGNFIPSNHLSAGIFASESLGGFGFGEGNTTMSDQVVVQLAGIGATVAWCAICTFIILKVVGMLTGGLRVTNEEEVQGLDIVSHNESGYNM